MPSMSKDKIEKLFNDNTIKDCDTVVSNREHSGGNTPVEGPFVSSQWDVNAFVKNLHYWQANTCEQKGKSRSSYGGCGVCTGVINRALESTISSRKYWATYPWQVCAKMKDSNSDFVEIQSGSQSNKQEFNFAYNPLRGDICTMWWKNHEDPSSPPFHTCAYDGKNWVSDFVQNTCNVYRSKNPLELEFHIFRHK